jgi:hypothetical protein
MSDAKTGRRDFMVKAGMLAGGSLLATAIARTAFAADPHDGMEGMDMGAMGMNHGASDGYVVAASMTKHCGMCEFWGGPRRVAENGKTLTITDLGWCNNPASPNYQKQTSADHGPMGT